MHVLSSGEMLSVGFLCIIWLLSILIHISGNNQPMEKNFEGNIEAAAKCTPWDSVFRGFFMEKHANCNKSYLLVC
jgi:hypothetical protein